MTQSLFRYFRNDLSASVVVFLVAVPLCLGIALASGAPPLAGLIAGIIGGIVVGTISGSQVGVSGPAAGLAVIVLNAIDNFGFELFLCAVVVGGLVQIGMGFARAGVLAYYFPSSVIKGMLAGIGVIIFLKQIPHAVGYNADYEGSLQFSQPEHENTITALFSMFNYLNLASILITAVSLGLLLLWDRPSVRQSKFGIVPGPLMAVTAGVLMGLGFTSTGVLPMGQEFFVDLPSISWSNASEVMQFPTWAGFANPVIWQTGAVIALVASLETLLCVEATDTLDPEKRVTPTNRELMAQGTGNVVSGLIGGLPITQVIVRSSANIQSGGKTKLSAIIHGFLLLFSLLLVPHVLRLIPLASLAAVLFVVGYRLARPSLFKMMWDRGIYQFVPFVATILGVVFTDLLTGVSIGLAIGIFSILYNNYRTPFHFDPEQFVPGEPVRIELSEDVSFLNKASIQRTLDELPEGAHVIIDARRTVGLDPDVEEIIRNAATRAPAHGVTIELEGVDTGRDRPERVGQFHEHLARVHNLKRRDRDAGKAESTAGTEAS
jgi:MFS superfamily sulfate permease-like transporter